MAISVEDLSVAGYVSSVPFEFYTSNVADIFENFHSFLMATCTMIYMVTSWYRCMRLVKLHCAGKGTSLLWDCFVSSFLKIFPHKCITPPKRLYETSVM